MNRIQVITADGEGSLGEKFRDAAALLEGLQLVAEARNPDRALELVHSLKPDVLVLDAGLAEDPEMLSRVRELSPDTRNLLVADRSDAEFVFRSVEQGAQGCVTHDCPPEDLARAVGRCRGASFGPRGGRWPGWWTGCWSGLARRPCLPSVSGRVR